MANSSGKQVGIFELGLYIMFIFTFKKLQNYFYSMTYFFSELPENGPYFWVNSRGNFEFSMALNVFTPVELNMRLGTCHSDKMEPILTVLEGKG